MMSPMITQAEMQECMQECMKCHTVCMETLTYCMQQGGMYATSEMMCMLLDCAEMCQTTANCMMRGSPMCIQMCTVCANVCTQCADMCMQMGEDARMQACAEACRCCAESCQKMTTMATA